MKILIIGGTGFLGRYVVEQLIQEQYDVTILTRDQQKMDVFSKQVSYVVGNLLNYQDIDFSPYTHIINCSGELNNEKIMRELHVDCIEGILKKLNKNFDIHWIQISSVGVYGKVRNGEVHENSPFAPKGQYEITKAEGELLVKRFCLENKINYTIIRPSNVFGIDMPNQSLAQVITIIKRKLFVYIGLDFKEIVMNYVPVEDVAQLVVLCLINENAINQEFIISDHIPIEDFVRIICNELKIENRFPRIPEVLIRMFAQLSLLIPQIPINPSRVDALTMRVEYSNKNASELLDYLPVLGLRAAMKNYIASLNNQAI